MFKQQLRKLKNILTLEDKQTIADDPRLKITVANVDQKLNSHRRANIEVFLEVATEVAKKRLARKKKLANQINSL